MKLSEMIEVLQAAERGEDIQFAFPNGMWSDLLRPNIEASWEFGRYNYRVKPKPLECWVTVLNGSLASTVHMSEEDANIVCRSAALRPVADKNGKIRYEKCLVCDTVHVYRCPVAPPCAPSPPLDRAA